MRILHVITSLYTGGAESLVMQIVPRMIAHGHEVEVALFDGTETAFRRQIEAAGVKVHAFSMGGSVYNPIYILKLRRLMKRFDIVHTHNTSPQLFAALAGIGMECVLCTTEHSTSNRRRTWKIFSLLDRWMYGRYAHVICISEKAEKMLRSFIHSDSSAISTIHNGIDVERFMNACPIPDFKARLPAGTRAITMVAGFRWEKDQDTLIRAMRLLPGDFHLFLVGQGVRRQECEALAHAEQVAERVHFLGLRMDVPSILKSSDYVVMSSHFEGLSLSSLEGMAVGKPFLASDVDGLHEVVKGAGILFPHGDSKALACEILRLENSMDEYEVVADRCRLRASKFDISKMVEGYIDIYNSL